MKRRLLNLVTVLSLLLCVAACVLWVRSYSVQDSVLWVCSPDTADGSVDLRTYAVVTVRGGVGFGRERNNYTAAMLRDDGFEPGTFRKRVLKPAKWTVAPTHRYVSIDFESTTPYSTSRMMRWAGPWPAFEAQWKKQPLQQFDVSAQRLAIPYWLAAVVTAVLPVARAARRLWRTPLPGHCRRCGYDLRATPGRCPECGSGVPDAIPGDSSAPKPLPP
jgi:hypothetical protein